MRIRQLVLVTHRWLGLASSVVLSIVGVTGVVFIWPIPTSSLLRRIAGPMHQELGLHEFGWWVVVTATFIAVLLEVGGIILWWRRKAFAVRTDLGWRRAFADLHHPAGLIGLPLMLLLAVSGVAMAFIGPGYHPEFRDTVVDLHTTRGFSNIVKVVYLVGTTGFLVQSVTGVVMWWKVRRRR